MLPSGTTGGQRTPSSFCPRSHNPRGITVWHGVSGAAGTSRSGRRSWRTCLLKARILFKSLPWRRGTQEAVGLREKRARREMSKKEKKKKKRRRGAYRDGESGEGGQSGLRSTGRNKPVINEIRRGRVKDEGKEAKGSGPAGWRGSWGAARARSRSSQRRLLRSLVPLAASEAAAAAAAAGGNWGGRPSARIYTCS